MLVADHVQLYHCTIRQLADGLNPFKAQEMMSYAQSRSHVTTLY